MKTAFILNNYFDTAGGGERSCLDLGCSLEEIGYTVRYVSTIKAEKTLNELGSRFDIIIPEHWNIEYYETDELLSNELIKKPDSIFFNHTYGSRFKSPLKNSYYIVMFPNAFEKKHREELKSYKLFICISNFVKIHMESRWPEFKNNIVLLPPITRKNLSFLNNKSKKILLVGRFNLLGHNKCQLQAISHFKKLYDEEVLSKWELVIIGGVNKDPSSTEYYEECIKESSNYPISIVPNAPYEFLLAEYQSASVLWQMTGQHLDHGYHPEECEHLGLVALDALKYGVTPVVYQRSGIQYELNFGVDSFCFSTYSELKDCMVLLDHMYDNKNYKNNWQKQLLENSENYTNLSYTKALKDHLTNQISPT